MIAGVDGCPGGWIVVARHRRGPPRAFVAAAFAEVAERLAGAAAVAVDMPIGLPARRRPGGRACDRAARRLLGPRAASVFSPPTRSQLSARSFARVRGLSLQSFHLLPRLREVDAVMTPALQATFFEAHPELAFARLNGRPLRASKHSAAGRAERIALLDLDFPRLRAEVARAAATDHDLHDACVLLDVAARRARGEAERVPPSPRRDARGLRMEIWS